VVWVLEWPAKLRVERDPVLTVYLAAADAAHESPCLLGGAVMHAKRAVDVITEPIGAKATSRNFPRWLRDALGEIWGGGRGPFGRAGIGGRVGETGVTARRGLARASVRGRVRRRAGDGRV
jgi:hypothetical protein